MYPAFKVWEPTKAAQNSGEGATEIGAPFPLFSGRWMAPFLIPSGREFLPPKQLSVFPFKSRQGIDHEHPPTNLIRSTAQGRYPRGTQPCRAIPYTVLPNKHSHSPLLPPPTCTAHIQVTLDLPLKVAECDGKHSSFFLFLDYSYYILAMYWYTETVPTS